MPRLNTNWLESFQELTRYNEAPRKFYFWAGVSAISAALRRKVWIYQDKFNWYPNMYVVFVAPPGVVSKSTTADTSMDLVREIPEIRMGPSVVTWQALVHSLGEPETFEYEGTTRSMSSMTIVSSEFGNLLDPQDKQMVDMLVNLWDGKGFVKSTKGSGTDTIVNPWINIIACTTPDWIAGSFPEYFIGGGFTSRCLFVYGDKKAQYVAYPGRLARRQASMAPLRASLIEDLRSIASLTGEYILTEEAFDWGEAWYEQWLKQDSRRFEGPRWGGYIARKQTHIHKLAMVLAAAQRDELIITKEDLEAANFAVTDLESEMEKVFDRIGMRTESVQAQRIIALVQSRGEMTYRELFQVMTRYFPGKAEVDDIVKSCIHSGAFHLVQRGTEYYVVPGEQSALKQSPLDAPIVP